jgi:hypothetical protein
VVANEDDRTTEPRGVVSDRQDDRLAGFGASLWRRRVALATVLATALALGGVALSLGNGHSDGVADPARPAATTVPTPTTMPADPAQRLALMRAFVAAKKSVHVEGTYGWSAPIEGLPQPLSQETKMRGDVVFPTHSHWTGEGLFYEEALTTPEGLFYRKAGTRAGLATKSWTRHPMTPEQYRQAKKDELLPGSPADPNALGFDVRKLPDVLDGLVAPEATVDGVKGRYRPDQTGEMTATVQLSMFPGTTGLQRMLWSLQRPTDAGEADAMTATVDLTFFDWDKPVEIAAPGAATLPDDTPAIDEAALGAYREVPLVAPATLPTGFRLVTAEVQDRLERGGCREVFLHYEDPTARAVTAGGSLATELELTIGREECRTDLEGEADNQPYAAGRYQGTFERSDPIDRRGENYDFTTVHLTVGGAAVEVSSSLSDAAIRAAVASLRPFVLADQPIYRQPVGR